MCARVFIHFCIACGLELDLALAGSSTTRETEVPSSRSVACIAVLRIVLFETHLRLVLGKFLVRLILIITTLMIYGCWMSFNGFYENLHFMFKRILRLSEMA